MEAEVDWHGCMAALKYGHEENLQHACMNAMHECKATWYTVAVANT